MSDANSTDNIQLDTELSAEDLARADLYGLLAMLFYKGPDAELLKTMSASLSAQELLAGATQTIKLSLLDEKWHALVDLANTCSAQQWDDEYETHFIGVGKQEIFLYASFYIAGFLNEKPLVQLRHDLQAIGLQGSDSVVETEDHIACLCEVMRYLIAGEDLGTCNLTQQKIFFNSHIRPWVEQLFDAIEAHPNIVIYAKVSSLARTFFEIEGQAFDMI